MAEALTVVSEVTVIAMTASSKFRMASIFAALTAVARAMPGLRARGLIAPIPVAVTQPVE